MSGIPEVRIRGFQDLERKRAMGSLNGVWSLLSEDCGKTRRPTGS